MRCSTDDGHLLIGLSTATSVDLADWQETIAGEDWWFRCQVDVGQPLPDERRTLTFDGIATVADVFVGDTLVLQSRSSFLRQSVDLSDDVVGVVEIAVCCRALEPLLEQQRRPRARWRTKLAHPNLRFFRTPLLGRTPGIAPDAPVAGLWRPVRFDRRRVLSVTSLRVRASLDGDVGTVSVRAAVTGATPSGAECRVGDGPPVPLHVTDGVLSGEVRVEHPERWWPHTHGDPVTYPVTVSVTTDDEDVVIEVGRVGFRTLTFLSEQANPQLIVNDVPIFVRGAIWTPGPADQLRTRLDRVVEAGMNMLRVVGTGAYEQPLFYDLCDELGISVWQDFMFANFDYPVADEEFRVLVQREAEQVVGALAHRPALAVLCGNSEIEQQVAMLGLDPALGPGELFGNLLPGVVDGAGCDAAYLPSSPTGGALPFRFNSGVSNYFGVGGYRRPLTDARLADVRFASECLALSNVPDDAAVATAGVPRDAGADWDFADVRDHYLAELYDVAPDALKQDEPDRYLALSREVSGELMAAVFGEWRRARSACTGGLVLWLADLEPGAGWGVLDDAGRPKVAYHHLRRINAPVAVWLTDEGLGGVAVHVANDHETALEATLRVTLYRDGEHAIADASVPVELAPRSTQEFDAEALLGRFADASRAYKFGPAEHDVVVASLEASGVPDRAPAVLFPEGRPLTPMSAEALGLSAEHVVHDGRPAVLLRSTRLVWGLRLQVPEAVPSDDAFCLEPGHDRLVWLDAVSVGGTVTALNLQGALAVAGP